MTMTDEFSDVPDSPTGSELPSSKDQSQGALIVKPPAVLRNLVALRCRCESR